MSSDLLHGFRVGPSTVEPLKGSITGPDNERCHVQPKVMDVLVCLAGRATDPVTRDELLKEVWGEHAVSDEPLTHAIGELRRVLHDDRSHPKYIETIPKRGYRLIEEVQLTEGSTVKPMIQGRQPGTSTEASGGKRLGNRAAIVLGSVGLIAIIGLYLVFGEYVSTGDTTSTFSANRSIAVLPFVNVSDDPGNEYFSDGISEEILNLLARVPDLQVTSRTSAFSTKGQNLDVPTMAAKLNVAHVLEGSVRKSGNRLRITVQLIEAETDTHLWSETYDRELADIFAIQDEIAAAVVDALKIELLGEAPKSNATDPAAYTLYLQGRHFLKQGTAEGSMQAEKLLKQALEIDPSFAPAWTSLGSAYRQQAGPFGIRPIDEGIALARHAIHEALAMDPQYGPAYAVLARLEMVNDWDIEAGHQHMQRALALNPGDPHTLVMAGTTEYTFGRVDEAIDLYRRAIAVDPLISWGYFNLGWALYTAHRLDEAADVLETARSLSQGGDMSHFLIGLVLLEQGDAPAALAAIEQTTGRAFRLLGTAMVRHALGDAGASDAALNEFIECCITGSSYNVAAVYAFRGEIDKAFEWLEKAYDNRDGALMSLVLADPLLANLHDDPRWKRFLDKMGFPH